MGVVSGRRPLIGISACLDEGQIHRPGEDYLYLNARYSAAVERVGGIPLVLPVTDGTACLERLDGLVISGGLDVHPRHYGEQVTAELSLEPDRQVDFDRRLIDGAVERGLPLLAVCYGLQLLNVHCGGSLHQRLETAPLDHGAPADARSHPVRVSRDSLLWRAIGEHEQITVVSAHRQAVKVLGQGLVATAVAPDGLVEAVELVGGEPLLGVQWHPEAAGGDDRLYQWLVEACSKSALP
jgi:gamma-glutamyl-gamma-aminobutyrate hydrolase PuuD